MTDLYRTNEEILKRLKRIEKAIELYPATLARLHHLRRRIHINRTKLQHALGHHPAFTEDTYMPNNPLDDAIDAAINEVAEEETIIDSAIAYIQSVPQLIQTAVDAALAAGATPAQLAKISDLKVKLDAKGEALKAALTANTPPA